MSERWIVIPRWDEFQHRDMARSSVPPWIKMYTRLLSDEAYLTLTPHRRALLHGLWMEYARTRRELTENTASLSRRLAMKVVRPDLEALNHAGFITFSASKVASEPAGLEVEVEVEREKEKNKTFTAPARFRVADPVWDFVVEIEGEPLPRHRSGRGRIVSDLKQLLDEQDVGEARRRHDALAREWGDAKATARALVQHWERAGRMADGEMRPPARNNNGRVSPSEVYAATTVRPEPEPVRRFELDAG